MEIIFTYILHPPRLPVMHPPPPLHNTPPWEYLVGSIICMEETVISITVLYVLCTYHFLISYDKNSANREYAVPGMWHRTQFSLEARH